MTSLGMRKTLIQLSDSPLGVILSLGTPGNIWRHFWLPQLGHGRHYLLVGGSQGHCSVSSSAQDGPPQRTIQLRLSIVWKLRTADLGSCQTHPLWRKGLSIVRSPWFTHKVGRFPLCRCRRRFQGTQRGTGNNLKKYCRGVVKILFFIILSKTMFL